MPPDYLRFFWRRTFYVAFPGMKCAGDERLTFFPQYPQMARPNDQPGSNRCVRTTWSAIMDTTIMNQQVKTPMDQVIFLAQWLVADHA